MLLVMLDLRLVTRLATIVPNKVVVLYMCFYLLVEANVTNIYNITFTDNIY